MDLAVSVHTSLVGQCHVHEARLVYFLYLMIYFRLQWWAEASDDVLNRLKESRADDFNRMMRDEWEGEFGDRRQELVFIGAGMDKEAGTPPTHSNFPPFSSACGLIHLAIFCLFRWSFRNRIDLI